MLESHAAPLVSFLVAVPAGCVLDVVVIAAAPLGITLPRLQTAANCNTAIERLFDGIVKGEVDRETAKLLIDTVQTRLRVLEVTSLEERLAELERMAEARRPPDGGKR